MAARKPGPLLALGAVKVMLVLLQLVGTMVKVFHCTTLVPCVAPKPVPVMVIAVPSGAAAGDID